MQICECADCWYDKSNYKHIARRAGIKKKEIEDQSMQQLTTISHTNICTTIGIEGITDDMIYLYDLSEDDLDFLQSIHDKTLSPGEPELTRFYSIIDSAKNNKFNAVSFENIAQFNVTTTD